MKIQRILAFVILLSFVFLFACEKEESPISKSGITGISFYSGIKSETELKIGKSDSGYFKISGEGEFDITDIVFSNSAPDVVSFEYDKSVLGDYVYYNIKALSPGEAVLYVTTTDGVIQSDKIKVTVIGETTKAPETTNKNDSDANVRTYILNTSSKKYHIEGCFSADTIKESNKSLFEGTPAELEDMGYEACQNCH